MTVLAAPSYQLRGFCSADIDIRVDWLNDDRVRRNLPIDGEITVRSTTEWHTRTAADPERFDAVLVGPDDRPLAMGGLTAWSARHRRAELYLFADPAHLGRGTGTETLRRLCDHGFRTLDLNRIYLFTLGLNPRARRFYEVSGFEEEGCQREHVLRLDGVAEDRYIHGLLRRDWTHQPWATSGGEADG